MSCAISIANMNHSSIKREWQEKLLNGDVIKYTSVPIVE